jgi:alcohol dehydrogenase (cytochrome c)
MPPRPALPAPLLALAAAGCLGVQPVHFVKAPVRDDVPTGAHRTSRGPGYDDRAALPAAPDPRRDWGTYNHTPDGARFSPLAELTPATVGGLRLACAFDTGERTSMQSGPVVVGGVLYLTSAKRTYAVDAATCRRRWTHTYAYRPAPPFDLRTNRGAAYVDAGAPGAPRPVLVRGANDGRVYALDARTGDEVWNVRAGDAERGETFPAAPVVYAPPGARPLVLIGNAGGDNYAVTGRLMAFDAATGARVWTFEFVPRPGPANATWPAETERVPRAGATTWTTYTLDTLAGVVYVPTGNATPNFLPQLRPGENDHTNSVVALDARTGAFRRAYKVLALDSHDYDVAAAPVLYQPPGAGPTVAVAGKDGYLHAFARAEGSGADGGAPTAVAGGARRWRTPITTLFNDTVVPTPGGVRFCPGVQGGAEWNGPAYDPARRVFVVGTVDWCTTVKAEPPDEVKGRVGVPWTGSAYRVLPFGKMDPRRDARGWVTAVDAATGAVRWRFRAPAPVVAGVTATAGGLTFTADQSGRIYAFETATGAVRWQADARQPVGGGVVTYAAGGRQYVAVASGLHAPLTWQVSSSPARVLVFARGGAER